MNVTGSEEAKTPESSRAGCIVPTDDGNNWVTAGFGGKCEPAKFFSKWLKNGVVGVITVTRRERAIRPGGRTTEECPERHNGLGRELGRDTGRLGGGAWTVKEAAAFF